VPWYIRWVLTRAETWNLFCRVVATRLVSLQTFDRARHRPASRLRKTAELPRPRAHSKRSQSPGTAISNADREPFGLPHPPPTRVGGSHSLCQARSPPPPISGTNARLQNWFFEVYVPPRDLRGLRPPRDLSAVVGSQGPRLLAGALVYWRKVDPMALVVSRQRRYLGGDAGAGSHSPPEPFTRNRSNRAEQLWTVKLPTRRRRSRNTTSPTSTR
jgi:hypothetical protein